MKSVFSLEYIIGIIILAAVIAINLYSYASARSAVNQKTKTATESVLNLEIFKDTVLDELSFKNKNGDVPVKIYSGDLVGN